MTIIHNRSIAPMRTGMRSRLYGSPQGGDGLEELDGQPMRRMPRRRNLVEPDEDVGLEEYDDDDLTDDDGVNQPN